MKTILFSVIALVAFATPLFTEAQGSCPPPSTREADGSCLAPRYESCETGCRTGYECNLETDLCEWVPGYTDCPMGGPNYRYVLNGSGECVYTPYGQGNTCQKCEAPAVKVGNTCRVLPVTLPVERDSCGNLEGEERLVNLLPDGVCDLGDVLSLVLGILVQIGSILLVLALVWVGFSFVAAQGNEEKIRSARDALMWTVIGGLLLLGAQALSLVIQATVQSL